MRLPFRGGHLLFTIKSVKRWAILPILTNLLLYSLILGGTLWWTGSWHWHLGAEEWHFWGGFGGWLQRSLNTSLDVVKWVLVPLIVFIICYFTFTSVGMILAAPFHDFLSERIEQWLSPSPPGPPVPFGRQVRQMLRNMLSTLRIVGRQLLAMVLTLPFLLIPLIGFLPLFLVTAYFTGVGFLDVAMARHNLPHAAKKSIIRSHRWHLLGMGMAMETMFLVPFAALFLLPMGVVAGTLLWHQVSARKT